MSHTEAAPTASQRGLPLQNNLRTSAVNGDNVQVNGSSSIEVRSLDQVVLVIRRLVTEHKGWVTQSNVETEVRPYANITLLVPKSSFYELLENIK